jgi:hypothetical protein
VAGSRTREGGRPQGSPTDRLGKVEQAGRGASRTRQRGAAQQQATEASIERALGNAQQAVDKVNSDYAQLVALSQIALDNQLPNGNATGANVQNGAFVIRISGTG